MSKLSIAKINHDYATFDLLGHLVSTIDDTESEMKGGQIILTKVLQKGLEKAAYAESVHMYSFRKAIYNLS